METGPLILVADDEAIILKVVTIILRKAGFRVLAASCGAQALQIAETSEEPIFLAVLDIVMPDLDGLELSIRLRGMYSDLRVLFISGYTLPPPGLPSGADFLGKPFTSDELLRRVNAVAARPVTDLG